MVSEIVSLARLNKPTGFCLLFVPCSWGLALSQAPVSYWIIFFFGAVFARSAGCIYNDLVDRKKDRMVSRTKNRPIASGAVTVAVGCVFLFLFGLCGFLLLLLLPYPKIIMAVLSLPLILLYPFMKRITWLPQVWLSFTFNWGVLVAGGLNIVTAFLYLGGIFWALAYDTMYGFQDYKDDKVAGIKSLPRLVGYDKGLVLISRFYMLAVVCWFIAGTFAFYNPLVYYGFCIVALIFSRFQLRKLDLTDSAQCLKKFKLEPILGGLITIGILTHYLVISLK